MSEEKTAAGARKLGLYFLASGAAALVNFLSRFAYDLTFEFATSVVLAYCTGMIVNFSLSKLFVFGARKSGNTWREGIKFLIVAGAGLAVTTLVSLAAVWAMQWRPVLSDAPLQYTIAHACGMAAGFVANFGGHKLVSFRETGLWARLRRPEP
jgi:putative flippase GtrA